MKASVHFDEQQKLKSLQAKWQADLLARKANKHLTRKLSASSKKLDESPKSPKVQKRKYYLDKCADSSSPKRLKPTATKRLSPTSPIKFEEGKNDQLPVFEQGEEIDD